MMGTPAYLSPEQIHGEPQNTRSDLFSLGIVLYQMVTGVPPFEGSSVSAVCAQILSADPIPPTQRNPALPPAIDHVIMRCLAKSPADRYPSAEALAASLYPFARLGPGTEMMPNPPVRRSGSWLARPMQPRDLWVVAALAVVAICGVPVSRAVAARYRLPAAPVMAKNTPAPPDDLLGYSQVTTVPDVEEDVAADVAQRCAEVSTYAAPTLACSRARRFIVSFPRRRIATAGFAPSAPELSPLPLASPVSRADHATLKIEIDSTVGDGALAIFADQTLLFTTDLHATTAGAPVRLEHTLPAGPHQLRVALYRADKSLQVAKEGLGDIHTDSHEHAAYSCVQTGEDAGASRNIAGRVVAERGNAYDFTGRCDVRQTLGIDEINSGWEGPGKPLPE